MTNTTNFSQTNMDNYHSNHTNTNITYHFYEIYDWPGSCFDMDCLWDRERKTRLPKLRPLTSLLSLIGLLGIMGNILVILVFSRRFRKQTSTYFILMLGILDLIACCLVIPGTLLKEWLFEYKIDFLCKLSELTRNFVIITSALTLTAISFDRFWLVYKKASQEGKSKMTLIMICTIIVTGISLGVPPMLGVGVFMEADDGGELLNIKVCIPNEILISEESLEMYWNFITALFGLLIIIIIVFYMLIFIMVYNHNNNTKRDHSIGKSTITSLATKKHGKGTGTFNTNLSNYRLTVNKNSNKNQFLKKTLTKQTHSVGSVAKIRRFFHRNKVNATDNDYVTIKIEPVGTSTSSDVSASGQCIKVERLNPNKDNEPQQSTSGINDREKITRKSIGTFLLQKLKTPNPAKTNDKSANQSNSIQVLAQSQPVRGVHRMSPLCHQTAHFKTTQVLCIITFVYVIAFLPMFLITHEVIAQNQIVFYLYFINNAANPIIYSFMNRKFRLDVWKMFNCNRRRRVLPA